MHVPQAGNQRLPGHIDDPRVARDFDVGAAPDLSNPTPFDNQRHVGPGDVAQPVHEVPAHERGDLGGATLMRLGIVGERAHLLFHVPRNEEGQRLFIPTSDRFPELGIRLNERDQVVRGVEPHRAESPVDAFDHVAVERRRSAPDLDDVGPSVGEGDLSPRERRQRLQATVQVVVVQHHLHRSRDVAVHGEERGRCCRRDRVGVSLTDGQRPRRHHELQHVGGVVFGDAPIAIERGGQIDAEAQLGFDTPDPPPFVFALECADHDRVPIRRDAERLFADQRLSAVHEKRSLVAHVLPARGTGRTPEEDRGQNQRRSNAEASPHRAR